MKALVQVEVHQDFYRKYLTPNARIEHTDPELARQLGQALLDAGAATIRDLGPCSPADQRDGYRRLQISVSVLNPLSPLAKNPDLYEPAHLQLH